MKKNYDSRSFFGGAIGLICGCLLILAGCKEEKGASAFDLVTPGKPRPVIDSLSPGGGAPAGSQPITIYGKNFSSRASEDFVFFNGKPANILSATATKIIVLSPVDSGMIPLKIGVAGSELFSLDYPYRLSLAVNSFQDFLPTGRVPYGLTPGVDTKLYAALGLGGHDSGVTSFTSEGVRAFYATGSASVPWKSVKFGPGGYLYATKGIGAVYRFAPGGGASAGLWKGISQTYTISDIDFDANHNLWVGGSVISGSTTIYRITQAIVQQGYSFAGTVGAVRCFNGYLYFGATVGSAGDTNAVYRAPIVADTLGIPEVYFDLSSAYPGKIYNVLAITFSADGDMYVGTNSPDNLLVVHQDKSFETPYTLYRASVLNSPPTSLAWVGNYIYASTSAGGLIQILVGKQGAPYYGIQ